MNNLSVQIVFINYLPMHENAGCCKQQQTEEYRKWGAIR